MNISNTLSFAPQEMRETRESLNGNHPCTPSCVSPTSCGVNPAFRTTKRLLLLSVLLSPFFCRSACFYESGADTPKIKRKRDWAYANLTLARFNLEWITLNGENLPAVKQSLRP